MKAQRRQRVPEDVPRWSVLLVEDEEYDRIMVAKALDGARERIRIDVTRTLAGARQALGEHAYDCALIDIGLPDGRGLSLLGAHSDVAKVMLTDFADQATESAARQAGADDFLVKEQVEGAAIVRAVRRAIELRQARRLVERQVARNELASLAGELRLALGRVGAALPRLEAPADEDQVAGHDALATARTLVARLERMAAGAPLRAPAQVPATAGSAARALPILVIDDEEPIRRAYTRMLRPHQVTAMGGREAALALARGDGPFALVICDLRMPDVDGLTVYEHVLAHRPELAGCFVFLSGGGISRRARRVIEALSVPLLVKPSGPDELLRYARDLEGPRAGK